MGRPSYRAERPRAKRQRVFVFYHTVMRRCLFHIAAKVSPDVLFLSNRYAGCRSSCGSGVRDTSLRDVEGWDCGSCEVAQSGEKLKACTSGVANVISSQVWLLERNRWVTEVL